jgi:hypothetical protein
MASALTFLERYHKDGNEFLSLVRVTGNETWVSFVNVETKEQPKQLDAQTFTQEAEKFKKSCLPARKLMVAVFWDRKGVLMVELMQ